MKNIVDTYDSKVNVLVHYYIPNKPSKAYGKKKNEGEDKMFKSTE